ncbi:hypothetical protein [Sphingobium lactosutens]|nr:hypothetical protein [Sphingobium lactosutens]
MHGGKTPALSQIERPGSDHHRALPHIAARLLYAKEAEREALLEIDNIAAGIERKVQTRFLFCAIVFSLSSFFALIGFFVWGAETLGQHDLGQRPAYVIFPLLLIAGAAAVYWRNFQYGLGLVRHKRPALYGKGRQSTIDTLESLFAYLGDRTGPKAYFYDRKGIRRPISRRHFFGRLRGLLLSEEPGARCLVMPPKGFWFSAQIFVEAEPEEIIRALKVKPQAGGRPKEYDYEAMLLTLIEHPSLRAIDPESSRIETQIMKLIHARCDPSEDHGNNIPVPEPTELRKFAKRIIAAIKNNRNPPTP